MARSLVRRFRANDYTPREAYIRATETPREVRSFAESVIAWSLANVSRDHRASIGSLPSRFGFRALDPRGDAGALRHVVATSDHLRVVVERDGP